MQIEVGTEDFVAVRRRKLSDHLVKCRRDLGDRLVPQCIGDTVCQFR